MIRRRKLSAAVHDERLRCAAILCPGCKEHGPPTWRTGNSGPDRYAQHPPYRVEVMGRSGTLVACLAEALWDTPGAPPRPDSQVEGMARIIEALLEEIRRRGVVPEADLTEYDEYRTARPREDA